MTVFSETGDVRILIVEDDPVIASAIQKKLLAWNMKSVRVEDFSSVLKTFEQLHPHLVLMDVALPEYSGYYWCEKIRAVSNVPILFLSSNGENTSQILAMTLGGDDYMTKPFDLDLLLSKIRAILRRSYDLVIRSDRIAVGDLFFDPKDRSLHFHEQKLELSKNESLILQTLMEQEGIIVSREKLMEKLWNTDQFVDDNTLSVNVNRLRRKLDSIGLKGLIQTRPSLGYLLDWKGWNHV